MLSWLIAEARSDAMKSPSVAGTQYLYDTPYSTMQVRSGPCIRYCRMHVLPLADVSLPLLDRASQLKTGVSHQILDLV